jgi:eukaryotic-like serine/threonine-protein kinase
VKLTDFGLARANDAASITQSGVIAGTPLHTAPEQVHGQVLDARADLFSLGCVLYALATGHPPFRAPTTLAVLKRVADDTPRPIADIVPESPAYLVAIITRLLEKNPDHR